MHPAKLIIGLGNPVPQYEHTRHNLGKYSVEQLAEHYGTQLKYSASLNAFSSTIVLSGNLVRLATTPCYMNLSGQPVHQLLRAFRFSIEELLVLHDDLEVPIGELRWKCGGGHGGHNGVRHIIQRNGSAAFTRLRIGIGRPPAGQSVADFVLSTPSRVERKILEEAKINIFHTIDVYYAKGLAAAQAELKNHMRNSGPQ